MVAIGMPGALGKVVEESEKVEKEWSAAKKIVWWEGKKRTLYGSNKLMLVTALNAI